MGRTVVVGDIHGCYDELLDLLEKISFGSDDRLVSVGDLIVKGEKNREVLELFISDKRFSAVLGNHDRKMLRHWKGKRVSLKKAHEDAIAELETGREKYASYLDSLPLVIELDNHLVVHAGVRPGVAIGEQAVEDLTELRTLGADARVEKARPGTKSMRARRLFSSAIGLRRCPGAGRML
ncbi:MAG: metallophosphoesterase [Pyrinomonadaceae bacterium]|nr:metallophosphoesterase [Pyrinomonadaceae bacterium]